MSRLTSQSVKDFLKAFNETLPYDVKFTSGRMPDMPDRACAIQRSSAPTNLYEGRFEQVNYRLQVRGVANNERDAERIGIDIDDFLDGQTNVMVGGSYCTSIWTLSGPRLISIADATSRFQYAADYAFLSEL